MIVLAEKDYKAATSVDEFFYSILDGDKSVDGKVYRVKFLQEIEVERSGEVSKAYGDGKIAELAYAPGDTNVTSQFHNIPMEDRKRIFNYKEDKGVMGDGSSNVPPYVAAVFAKTFEDGSKEYVGLPKGMFMPPNTQGQTSEDSKEFSSQEIEGEFMERKVEGFNEDMSVLFAKVEKNDKDSIRNELFTKLFGENFEEITGPDSGSSSGSGSGSGGSSSGSGGSKS